MTLETNLPKVLMISMSHNTKSTYYRDRCSASWEKRGYTVEHFEAITPIDLNRSVEGRLDFLDFGKKKFRINFTPTEKAIWYSIMLAIKKVSESSEPYIIVEHDALLLKAIPEELFLKNNFIFLCHANKGLTPCGAFYITPETGSWIMNCESLKSVVNFNVDGQLLAWNKALGGMTEKQYVKQFVNPKIGVTIEHKK